MALEAVDEVEGVGRTDETGQSSQLPGAADLLVDCSRQGIEINMASLDLLSGLPQGSGDVGRNLQQVTEHLQRPISQLGAARTPPFLLFEEHGTAERQSYT
ncbi:MAG TPA: hypothetical protein VF221_09555 [Chloroflexota bacterium]